MIAPRHALIRSLGSAVAAIGLAGLLAGCWPLMALELAPMGLHAAEAVTINTADSISGRDPAGDDEEDAAKCDQLASALPYIAELRQNADGSVEIRQWGLEAASGKRQWSVMPDGSSSPDGWRAESDLASMNFSPRLEPTLGSEHARYLIFAPAEARDSAENEQLVSFISSFGPADGTFQWHGRIYRYALAKRLPCFATPS